MGVNMTLPAAFEDTLSTQEQIQWLYKYKEALLTAGANIQITRQGDTVVISAIGEGFSPTVEVTEIAGGHEVTITDGTGPHVFDVMDGVDGEDGVSPAVVITSITGGHRVVITDEDHPSGQSFDVMDGVDGTDGTSITVKSVTPTSGGVNLVITDSAGDHTIFLANGPQGLTGPQGPQGPTGATGATGETGATPEITMTASSDGTYSATPTVTVVKGGTDLNPTFSLAFSGLRGQTGATGATGEQGPAGQDGSDGEDGVSPEVTIASITGGHSVTITDAEHPSGQTFNVMDGTDGQDGTNGTNGTDGVSPEVTITSISGGHEVTITDADHPSGQSFDVMDGTDGQDGTNGQDGVTPVISATATADASHSSNPSVTVTKSGTDAAPSFAFAFSGLQGEQGAAGQDGQDGAPGQGVPAGGTAGQYLKKNSNTDYDTTWTAPPAGLPSYSSADNGKVLAISPVGSVPAWENRGVPTGGTAGQVLTKNSSSNWDASWKTPAAGGGSSKLTYVDDTGRRDTYNIIFGDTNTAGVAGSSSTSKGYGMFPAIKLERYSDTTTVYKFVDNSPFGNTSAAAGYASNSPIYSCTTESAGSNVSMIRLTICNMNNSAPAISSRTWGDGGTLNDSNTVAYRSGGMVKIGTTYYSCLKVIRVVNKMGGNTISYPHPVVDYILPQTIASIASGTAIELY